MAFVAYERKIPVKGDYDVIVAGGGPSGFIAAIAAARSGARTAVIERNAFLGGTATAGMVAPISVCCFDGELVQGGIHWEFIQRLEAEGGAKVEYPLGNVSFSPEKYKLIAARMVREAGVKRYHCNLETSARFFPNLCTTHTPEEKKATIRAARAAGLQVCSGGIIGMGESMEDRIDLALELRELDVDSVPLNILNPIKGTPLEHQPLISEEEVIRTVAVFRFLLPRKTLRFAGGRMRLSRESTARILRGGMNGALMGDMLTSIGNQVADDKRLFAECGLDI